MTTVLRADDLEKIFREPPASARPWVFWHWVGGAVSREGITADLEAMKSAGIAGAYLMAINAPANPPVFTPAVKQLTPEWWAMVKHAATEADRVGVSLGFHVSDGFATAGGPWITPELSMQRVTWSETFAEGGKALTQPLIQPPTKENFYRDIAVLAFPTPEGATHLAGVSLDGAPGRRQATPLHEPRITTSLPGFDAQFLAGAVPPDLSAIASAKAEASAKEGVKQLRTDQPCWIQYEYAQPFTLRSLVIKQWDRNYGGVYHATRLKLEASDDGVAWRPLTRLEPPRHGWQDWDADYTFSVTPVTARFFRFLHDPTGAETGSEDFNGAKWRPRLILRGLELSSAPRVPGFEGKSGAVWRSSAPATADQLPAALCVPREKVIDLTAKLGADGRLDWTPPPSPVGYGATSPPTRWTILRIGHTSTGHQNETGGGGKGLECDKFNPAAVRLQFDRWFAEAVKQIGPELARRVLKVLLSDSWEAGSQNWSPVFRAEFQHRRGYDPTTMLPVFAGVPVGSAAESEKFLADVRLTIADLLNESYFGTLRELAHAHGCEFIAESTAPTMLADHLRHFGIVDVPMGEFWLRSPQHDKPNDVHDAISGARIYGKNIVQAEAFTELRLQWDEHPAMLKALADHNFALGLNRLALHVFALNPWLNRKPGVTLNGVGTYFQRDQTWWPEARAWHDYLARCSALLQTGRPVVDVAYFAGEDPPIRAILPERRSPALPPGYSADSINADALLRLAKVEQGRLVLPGGACYAALVVPPGPRSPALAAKLNEFRRAGLAVVEKDFGPALAKVPPALLTPASEIEWTHRTSADADLYFISNQQPVARSVEVSIRGTGRQPEIWRPVTGAIEPAASSREAGGRTIVSLPLDPHGSVFVVLRGGGPSSSWAGSRSSRPRVAREAAAQLELGPPKRDLHVVRESLDGPWQVTFDPTLGGPPDSVEFPALTDWTAHATAGIRDYSGPAVYARTFEWSRTSARAWLDLGKVENIARVFVNGVDCGVAWTPPYRVEITSALRPGVNRLEIRVVNTWSNRLRADRLAPPATGPITWTTAPAREDAKPLPAGLFGPVQVLVLSLKD